MIDVEVLKRNLDCRMLVEQIERENAQMQAARRG